MFSFALARYLTWIRSAAVQCLGRERFAIILVASLVGGAASAGDLGFVPFWDGETTATPNGLLTNRYGGPVIHQGGTKTSVQHTTATVYDGSGAFQVSTIGSINAGSFGFFQTALTPFGPNSTYVHSRDVSRFDQLSFWLNNATGEAFTLKFEVKDYRDSGSHLASRNYAIAAGSAWQQITVPMSLTAPDWNVTGSPEMRRARFFGFVIDANQGQTVNGSVYFDQMAFVEPGPAVDIATAPVSVLAERVARRQFDGLWGLRNRTNGMLPISSTSGDTAALNVTSAMVKMVPGAVARGWITQSEADGYVTQVATSLNTMLNAPSSSFLPPRYFDWVSLAPKINEESSVDAAFMALALHQYKQLPNTSAALRTTLDQVQNRFNFAAFSDTQAPTLGWKLAFNTSTQSMTAGTYDGYSGEPWLISLAAELSQAHHVPITTHYHSGVFRSPDFVNSQNNLHFVHSFEQFRAPFLQWLMPLFVDVSDRGVDTYPNPVLATNPLRNAEKYQRDVDAYFAALGRGHFLQPDAGDDGSGAFYQQFSAYDDHGRPDLFMPWSSAFSLWGDEPLGEAALRHHLEMLLHGPLGLADSTRWTTGAGNYSSLPAGMDLWNTALSTMALLEWLYGDSQYLTSLAEVDSALDQVFRVPADANGDGCVSGADFTIWADHFGDGPGALFDNGDFNSDGFITGADFTLWADHFGVGCAPLAVPEPSSNVLGIASIVAGVVIARGRKSFHRPM